MLKTCIDFVLPSAESTCYNRIDIEVRVTREDVDDGVTDSEDKEQLTSAAGQHGGRPSN